MRGFWAIIFALLGLLLPVHGFVTVMLPAEFRWWKEILLAVILLGVIVIEFKHIITQKHKGLMTIIQDQIKSWSKPEILAKTFIVYLLFLVLFNTEPIRALYAARYLALFYFTFLIVSRLLAFWNPNRQASGFSFYKAFFKDSPWRQKLCRLYYKGIDFKKLQLPSFFDFFAHYFLAGCMLSLAFGVWIKLGNGADVMTNFYSTTISSWVPGQAIPLWHEIGGQARMQGMASGPIEFSHLLVLCLALVPRLWFRDFSRLMITIVLLYGIWMSASRAAIVAAVLVIFFWGMAFIQEKRAGKPALIKKKQSKYFRITLIVIALLAPVLFWFQSDSLLNRAGTMDHFTRPFSAIEFGLKSPIIGSLGEIGPAARWWNLNHFNDDKALIAENIFADTFAQTGIIGVLMILWFWFFVWKNLPKRMPTAEWWKVKTKPWSMHGIFLALFFMVNFATIFDMTPISIAYGALFAFLLRTQTAK